MMNAEEFKRQLLINGADFGRWPAGQRWAAEQLLQHNPELQVLVAAEQRFETALHALPGAPPPPAHFTADILAVSRQQGVPKPETIAMLIGRLFADFHLPAPGFAMALVLLMGMFIGFSLSPPTADSVPVNNSLQASLDYQGEIL
ncbi:MAG: hypothetical protein JXO49_05105 [Deltaproteobacteria bacterium]|nr:hypothetical protein [Candidatus Anaeroferrophillus wilburensis]MBN2888705.1 hypothetical protein [Deltaproteobacteria bacterium]